MGSGWLACVACVRLQVRCGGADGRIHMASFQPLSPASLPALLACWKADLVKLHIRLQTAVSAFPWLQLHLRAVQRTLQTQ